MKIDINELEGKNDEEIGKYFREQLKEKEDIDLSFKDKPGDEDDLSIPGKDKIKYSCKECGKDYFSKKPLEKCPFCDKPMLAKEVKHEEEEQQIDIINFEGTVALTNFPIFKTGTHNGKTYSEADLDNIVKNFDSLKEVVKPPLKLGHGKQTMLKEEGLPAAGWVTKVNRKGNILFADLRQVPKRVYELLKNGAWKRPSAEIYTNFKDEKGKEYGLTLAGVALLGADAPAIKSLPDIEMLYNSAKEHNETDLVELDFSETNENGGNEEMVSEEITKELEELKKKDQERSDEIEKLKAKLELSEKSERKAKEMAIFSELKAKGKITPAMEPNLSMILDLMNDDDRVVKFTEKIDNEDVTVTKTPYKLFLETLEKLPEVVDFSERTRNSQGKVVLETKRNGIEYDPSTETLEDEEIADEIQKYMEENDIEMNAENYANAMIEVSKKK